MKKRAWITLGCVIMRVGWVDEAQEGKIDWCFFDETGLNLNPNVPYAWQEKGTTARLLAQRTRGIALLGILNPINNKLTVNRYKGPANAQCVIQTLDESSLNLSKKTILILDNASIHKAEIVKQHYAIFFLST